jgi:hypothetical protein
MFSKLNPTNIFNQRHVSFSYLFGVIIMLFVVLQPKAEAQSDEYKEAFSAYQTQNFSKAGEIWEKLADQGDVNALYALGVMTLRGEADNADEKQAFEWFQQAANKGHSTAMFNVGVAFWQGSGAEQDREKALSWWEQSANAGDSGAQFNLGLAYYIGEERPTDLKQAAKWIGMAASQNHPEANRIYNIISEENPDIIKSLAQEQIIASSDASSLASKSISASDSTLNSINKEPNVTNQPESPDDVTVEPDAPVEIKFWRTNSSATLRVSADPSSATFGNLPEGTPVELIESEGDWTRVTLPAGLKMFVYENFLSVTGDKGVINGTRVRVRPRPSTDNTISPPVGEYRNGDRVVVLSRNNKWYGVRAPKHIGGWIPSSGIESYLDSVENREKLWTLMIEKGL